MDTLPVSKACRCYVDYLYDRWHSSVHLALGHQPVGIYQHRSRAAHWDGKNALGESVVSGVYFYTLSAGDFTTTRKMLIQTISKVFCCLRGDMKPSFPLRKLDIPHSL